ncbi:MAG: septum formation initiator family protein [Thiotrichaceae bacterium]
MIKILTILFGVILVFLLGRLWLGNGSFPQIWHMQDQIETLSTSNKQKQEENRKLEAEIQEFQGGTEAIEARARNDFGMMKKGETFYQIILNPGQQEDGSVTNSAQNKSQTKGKE